MHRWLASLILLVALGAACAGTERPILMVEIVTGLEVPEEANEITVRVIDVDRVIGEESYPLAGTDGPDWPQTVPIVGGDEHAVEVKLTAEIRMKLGDLAPQIVAYGEVTATFPETGSRTVSLVALRICDDADGDAYGVGVGCRGLDCDDADPQVPNPTPCPLVDCAAGCGVTEVCYENACLSRCNTFADCGGVIFAECVKPPGACVCRSPCDHDNECLICYPSHDNCQYSYQLICIGSCCVL